MWTDPVWTDPVWTEVYMYAAMAMSLGGAGLLMLIATGAMVSGQQQSMSYMQYCSVCMPSQNQLDGIIITGNSDHYRSTYIYHYGHCDMNVSFYVCKTSNHIKQCG